MSGVRDFKQMCEHVLKGKHERMTWRATFGENVVEKCRLSRTTSIGLSHKFHVTVGSGGVPDESRLEVERDPPAGGGEQAIHSCVMRPADGGIQFRPAFNRERSRHGEPLLTHRIGNQRCHVDVHVTPGGGQVDFESSFQDTGSFHAWGDKELPATPPRTPGGFGRFMASDRQRRARNMDVLGPNSMHGPNQNLYYDHEDVVLSRSMIDEIAEESEDE